MVVASKHDRKGAGRELVSMEANGGLGSTAVDLTVECKWLERAETPTFAPDFCAR
jgi:hypothetical protein